MLLELLEQNNLSEIEVTVGDSTVILKSATAQAVPMGAYGAPVPVAAPAPRPAAPEVGEQVLAPMAGIFYRASSPEAPPYADPGDEVHVGDTIALIEAMKLYNEVTSHVHGKVIKFLAGNGDHVEADQPLALVERVIQ